MSGFTFGYLEAWRGDTRVCLVPYFVVYFYINTMFPEGFLKKSLDWLKLKVACVGHPVSDFCPIEGVPDAEALEAINKELEKKSNLIAYKGLGPDLPVSGFVKVAGLPVAILRLKEDYWSGLKSHYRKNFKAALRKGANLRVFEEANLSCDQAKEIYDLYHKTYARAAMKFEELNVEHFIEMAKISTYLMFYEDETLIGFVQLLIKSRRLVFRYIGMDYDRSEKYGLYFIMFLRAIEIALREKCTEIDYGSTCYDFKRRLGCEMVPTWIYYRHKNPVLNWILGRAKFLLEPSKEELAGLSH